MKTFPVSKKELTMKTKSPIPEYILPDDMPFTFEAGLLADKIQNSLLSAIEKDSMSIIEMAGLLGMGACLRDYADGKLQGLMGHSFMRILADKKTPSPVTRTENVTYMNIKEGLAEMIELNPDALERTNKIADERRIQIQNKLRTDNLLMLRKKDVDDIAKGEPEEIQKLRGVEEHRSETTSSRELRGDGGG